MSYFPLPWCENSKNCLNELLVKLIRPGPGKIKNQKHKNNRDKITSERAINLGNQGI